MDWISLAQDREEQRPVINIADESAGSMKCGKFLNQLSRSQFLKDSTLWSESGQMKSVNMYCAIRNKDKFHDAVGKIIVYQ